MKVPHWSRPHVSNYCTWKIGGKTKVNKTRWLVVHYYTRIRYLSGNTKQLYNLIMLYGIIFCWRMHGHFQVSNIVPVNNKPVPIITFFLLPEEKLGLTWLTHIFVVFFFMWWCLTVSDYRHPRAPLTLEELQVRCRPFEGEPVHSCQSIALRRCLVITGTNLKSWKKQLVP